MKKHILFSNPSLYDKLKAKVITATIRTGYYIEKQSIKENETIDIVFKRGRITENLGLVKILAIREIKDIEALVDLAIMRTGYRNKTELCRALIRYLRYNTYFAKDFKTQYENKKITPCEFVKYLAYSGLYYITFEWLDKKRDLQLLLKLMKEEAVANA